MRNIVLKFEVEFNGQVLI